MVKKVIPRLRETVSWPHLVSVLEFSRNLGPTFFFLFTVRVAFTHVLQLSTLNLRMALPLASIAAVLRRRTFSLCIRSRLSLSASPPLLFPLSSVST